MAGASIREKFGEDHARLERELQAVLDTVETADFREIQAQWARLDAGLRAHFDAEERFVLPVVEPGHPEEAARLRADHARFRRRLTDLGVMGDLHALRLGEVSEFLSELARHARWESDTIYPAADETLDLAARRGAIDWLVDRAKALLARRAETTGWN